MALGHDELIYSDGGLRAGVTERDRHQHGGDGRHLSGSSDNVDPVGKLALTNVEPSKIADVGVTEDGNTAFLAAWGGETCRMLRAAVYARAEGRSGTPCTPVRSGRCLLYV
jgi:hypothetical protein